MCYDDGLDGICNVFALFNNQNCKKKKKQLIMHLYQALSYFCGSVLWMYLVISVIYLFTVVV